MSVETRKLLVCDQCQKEKVIQYPSEQEWYIVGVGALEWLQVKRYGEHTTKEFCSPQCLSDFYSRKG